MKTYMLTIPRQVEDEGVTGNAYDVLHVEKIEVKVHKRMIQEMLWANDAKKWIVAMETGRNGYEHWQIRVQVSNDSFFDWVHEMIPWAHVEEAEDRWTYERKEGCYWCSWDTPEIRQERFGQPQGWQRRALKRARTQSVREVDIWYDPVGSRGKSWLAGHLMETGEGLLVPRDWGTASEISNFLYHNYDGQPYVIIDIPRDKKVPDDFYTVVEMVKDGFVGSVKWEGGIRNIRGVKVIVFTNHKLDPKRLSQDRWRFNYITESAV